jgi:hypothetical protein
MAANIKGFQEQQNQVATDQDGKWPQTIFAYKRQVANDRANC